MLLRLIALTVLLAPVSAADYGRPVRLALVSDLHFSRATAGEAAQYVARARQAVAHVNAEGVDAVLLAGDLTESGAEDELAGVAELLRGFRAPLVAVPGNHDVGARRRPGSDQGVNSESVRRYERALGHVGSAVRVRWLRVIPLNSALPGSGLPEEQAHWRSLERALDAPGPVVLLTHHPLFLRTPVEGPDAYWTIDPAPRARLLDLIARAQVPAVLSGHLHYGQERREGRTLHLTTPPVSFGLPRGKQPEGWTLVTVTRSGAVRSEFKPLQLGAER